MPESAYWGGRRIPVPLHSYFFNPRIVMARTRQGMWTLALAFALITILPLKWAADFTGTARSGLLACTAASLLGPALAVAAYRLSEGSFMGGVVAYVALLGGYLLILRVPGRSILGFAVVVLTLQLAVTAALISFNDGRIDIGWAS